MNKVDETIKGGSKMKLGTLRKMRLLNLIVCLAFCLNLGLSGNVLASGRVAVASEKASMLRPQSASQRLGDIVLDMKIEKLRELAAQGSKVLEKALVDLVRSKDPSLTALIENNIVVVKKGDKTFVVCTLDNGWYIDLIKEGELKKVSFASAKEKFDFMTDAQRLWVSIMGMDATPRQIHEAQIAADAYVRKAGEEGTIFTETNLAKEVEEHAKKKKLSPEAQAAFLKEMQADIAFRKRAIDSLTQEKVLKFFQGENAPTPFSLDVEHIKRDLSDDLAIRKAIIYDENGDPVFKLIGSPLDFEYLAVTASSGTGFVFPGYKGDFPRSTFEISQMTKSYREMYEVGDQDALEAYQAKILHEYAMVNSESKKLRRETQEVRDLIHKYDDKAIMNWVEREVEKANARILQEENKKTIAEATSANIGKFLKGGVVSSELIAVAEAELQKLVVEKKLLTGYRIIIKDGKVSILTTRKNSQAEEDSAKIPSAILNVYLSVLNAAKDENRKVGDYLIYVGEDLTGKTYRQQTDALEISVPLPTLTYLEPQGWAKNFFARKIRTELTVPEGQPKGFFTRVYNGYVIGGLFVKPLEQIPDAVVNAVRAKLNQDIAQGKILSAEVRDFGARDIKVIVTHRYGQLNAAVTRLILEAMKEGVLKAKELGLLREDIDVASMSLEDLGKELRVTANEDSITERGAEPVVIMQMVGAGMGAVNINEYSQFFIPGSTPLQTLGVLLKGKAGPRGWRAIARRIDDVLKGNYDGPVWEFEMSLEFEDAKGTKYNSVNHSIQALLLAGSPNDYVVTEIWPVEGSALPSTEPVITVVYQPVYGEKGELRALNPTIIARSQSGADAVGGIAGIWYAPHFVPGGDNAEHAVVTKPVTLEEARKAPPKGIAYLTFWGWQSEGGGIIPTEEGTRIDHVAANLPAVGPERRIADWLASIMNTWPDDQPSLTPAAAEARVAPIREAQRDLFETSPKETDPDPVMAALEALVASGELLSFYDGKGDMGGLLGHNFTPSYMLAIDLATAIEYIEKGIITDGNIIGFVEKMRLKKGLIYDIGDDEHFLLLGDKSRNAEQSNKLTFLAFTRGYLASVVGNDIKAPRPKGLYGRGQDFAGKEAKAAMANPYFYSQFSERFFEILREVMPEDHMNMVDLMYAGWKKWQQTSKETTVLLPSFSGNVSHQGIGTARYLVDIKGGERRVGILAGDKMGPAADNIVIRESAYALLKAIKEGTASVPEWIKDVTLTESQVKEIGLDWSNVFTKLTKNGWAEKMTDTEVRLKANWEAEEDPMRLVFGDDFFKILRILQKLQKDRQVEYAYLSNLLEQLKNGLVFEIQDAKAYDKNGNIRIDRLPELYNDITEYFEGLQEKIKKHTLPTAEDFIAAKIAPERKIEDGRILSFIADCYKDGSLRNDLSVADKESLAFYIKEAGFVPTERIYLDAQEDKTAIGIYLADSDRFNVKQLWSKKKAGWDIHNRQEYLDKPILGSSVTKLGIIAGGNYIGKDDPVMVGNILLMEYVFEFFKTHPYLIIQGDMNGSHWLAAVPTASQNAVATKDSQPILVGFRYTLSEDGMKLAKAESVFDSKDYDPIRKELFEFNREFKISCIGGQVWPYGTDVRTVEGAYPKAQAIRELNDPESPFLVKNQPAAKRKTRPIAPLGELVDLFKTATGTLEMPAASEGWTGADESAQRFQKSLLAQQGPIGGKLSDAAIKGAQGEKKYVLIKADSALESDDSLILALQSINRQTNQSFGILKSDANIPINAYQFILAFDRPELNTAENVKKLFAGIAEITKNGAKADETIAAMILTQQDMFKGWEIANAADLLDQLDYLGIPKESIKGLVGPEKWTKGLRDALAVALDKKGEDIAKNVVSGYTDAGENEIIFAGNVLFGVVEAIATNDKQLPSAVAQELELIQEAVSTIAVKDKEFKTSIADEIESYRKQVEAAIRV